MLFETLKHSRRSAERSEHERKPPRPVVELHMSPASSAMLQQNNNNNYPCLNMTGPDRGEGLRACPRAQGHALPSRMELSLGALPLVRGLRAWALCSKNRLKAKGELGGGGHAPTIGPTTPSSTTHGRLTSGPRPADMYPAGELGGMGYGLDARQAGIGALVTVATLKTSEVGGKTQTQCLFLRTEKGSCLYSTTKPGGWSLGKGPGMTATGASALVGSWLRGKVIGGGEGGGGGGGGAAHQATKRTGGPPLAPAPAAPQSAGSNRVRLRSGRRWRKSCGSGGLGQTKTAGSQRRGREDEAGEEAVLGERQEGRDKGEFPRDPQGGEEAPRAQPDRAAGGRKQEGGAGSRRSCRCCHNASGRNCARCARRAARSGGRHRTEEREGPAAEETAMNRRGGEEEGRPNGGLEKEKEEQEEEEEKREEKGRSEPLDSIVPVPNADSQTNGLYPESFGGSRSQASKKSSEKDIRGINEALQTETCAYSENKEDPCSQNTPDHRRYHDTGRTPGDPCGEEQRCPSLDRSLPPAAGPLSPALATQDPVQRHCEDGSRRAVADAEPRPDPEDCGNAQGYEGSRLSSAGPVAADTALCCEAGLQRLTSAAPVEGSSRPAELSLDAVQRQQASSAADTGEHTENAGEHRKGRPHVSPVNSGCRRLMQRESSSVASRTEKEEEPLKGAGLVTCTEPEGGSPEGRGESGSPVSPGDEGKAGGEQVERAAPAAGQEEEEEAAPEGGADQEVDGGALPPADEEEGDKGLSDEEERGGAGFKARRPAWSGFEGGDEGQRAPGLRGDDGRQGIRGEETTATMMMMMKKRKTEGDEGLRDGRAGAADDGEEEERGDSEGELDEETPGERGGGRERGDALRDSGFSAAGRTPEWAGATSPSPPPLKEEVEEEVVRRRRGRDGGQAPVANEQTCCPLPLIPPITNAAPGSPLPDPPLCKTHARANPAPPPAPPPPGAMATDPQRPGAGARSGSTGSQGGARGVQEEEGKEERETASGRIEEPRPGEEEERGEEQRATVATEHWEPGEEEEKKENGETQKEEEEFGVFMQADAEPGWGEGFAPPAPVDCGNTENTGEFTQWTSGWTDDSFHQSDESWSAFSQDPLVASAEPVAQWWPVPAGDGRMGRLSSNQNAMEVLAEAFPSSGQLASDPDPGPWSDAVPTLTQLLQGERHHSRTTQDQGLLENFHDLNKMIGRRYKRANGVSRDLLLKTLHLEPAPAEIRNICRPTNHRLSPGLPSANRHAQSSKRRLSYDCNRNIAD